MDDKTLTDHIIAVSGKADRILTRLAENEAKIHDILERLAAIQVKISTLK